MGVTVNASIGTEKYYTKVRAGDHEIYTDEPVDKGGGNKGLNPFELLAASLATCTVATLRMYIDRKGWDIPTIDVEVFLKIIQEPKPRYSKEKFLLVKRF